jgi:hypothetical protein
MAKHKTITISHSSGFKTVRIGYLGDVANGGSRQFVRALKRHAIKLFGPESVIIITNNSTPPFWACMMIAAACATKVPMVAIDTRERNKKSCIVVGSWCPEYKIGERFSNPTPDGSLYRHTVVAKKKS